MGKCEKNRVLRYKRRQTKVKQQKKKEIKIYNAISKQVCDEMLNIIEVEAIEFEKETQAKKSRKNKKKENVIRKCNEYLDFIFLDVNLSEDEKQLHFNRFNTIFDKLY